MVDPEPSAKNARLRSEIRRYCGAHPHARDSVEGIAWWLALQRYDDTLQEVRAAVDALVGEGVLVPFRLSDGSIVFGCANGDGASCSR
jgi:hypothetical protein